MGPDLAMRRGRGAEADNRQAAAALAVAPTTGLAAAKRAIQSSAHNSLEAQLDLERDLQRALGHGADYREGVAAFAEKRAPRFTGR